jgi:hypothetical protein
MQAADGLCFIEVDGVLFTFDMETPESLKLRSIAFKVQILPKGVPTMQVPRHLFGELGKTAPGVERLKKTRHLEDYMQKLDENFPILVKRAFLWALGHTGASNTGANYLCKIGAIKKMVNIAERSSVLSLRGTASQALSLVARSSVGRSELNKYSWISAEPQSAAIAVPMKAESIFWIEENEELIPYREKSRAIDGILDEIELNEQEKDILKHVCVLGSVINKSESEQFLRNLRSTAPLAFQSIPLFHAVMVTIAAYSFKLQTRRTIHKIFERIHRIEGIEKLDAYPYIS